VNTIELAKDAGFDTDLPSFKNGTAIALKLAALVRAEYEAPLKLAEEALTGLTENDSVNAYFADTRNKALAAIREALADHVEQSLTMVADHSELAAKANSGLVYLSAIREALANHSGGANKMVAEPVKQEPVKMMNSAGNTEAYLPEQQTAGFTIPLYAAPVDAKAIRAEALEEAANKAWDVAPSDEAAEKIAAAIRGLK
jgi:hypothetical protein